MPSGHHPIPIPIWAGVCLASRGNRHITVTNHIVYFIGIEKGGDCCPVSLVLLITEIIPHADVLNAHAEIIYPLPALVL